MKTKDIKYLLKQDFEKITPNDFDKLENMKIVPEKLPIKENKRFVFKWAFAAMATVLLMIFGFSTFLIKNNLVYASVSIDINPGVEITLNQNEMVKSVEYINVDGQALIYGLSLKGKSLGYVLKELVKRAKNQGYLNNPSALMYSIESDNQTIINNLKNKLAEYIQNALEENQIQNCELVTGRYSNELREEAKNLNVSVAKLSLIYEIIDINPALTKEELASKSIRYLLNLIAD